MKKYLLLFFLYYLIIVILTPKIGFGPDESDTARWTGMFLQTGIWNAYKEGVNYPPVSLYVYYLYGLLAVFLHVDLLKYVFLSKYITVLFDVGSFYIVLQGLRYFKISLIKMLLVMGNLTLLYTSIIWGQFDSVYTFFCFLAVYLALRTRPLLAYMSLILAVNAKPQAIIFVPIIIILILPFVKRDFSLLFKIVGISIFTQIVIFLPFIFYGTEFDYIYVLSHTTSYFPVVTKNAFNFWLLMFGDSHQATPDSIKIFGVTTYIWGLILFTITYFISLLPLIGILAKHMKEKTIQLFTKKDWKIIFLAISLSCIAFFFFNTQMHERYANPAIIFACVYAILSNKYLYYFGLSAAYLLNLMYVFNTFSYDLSLYISPANIALLYLLVFLFGMYQLYLLFFSKNEEGEKSVIKYL